MSHAFRMYNVRYRWMRDIGNFCFEIFLENSCCMPIMPRIRFKGPDQINCEWKIKNRIRTKKKELIEFSS